MKVTPLDFLLFFIFSVLEFLGLYGIMLSMFRIKIKQYGLAILIICIPLTLLSYTLRELFSLAHIAPFIILSTFIFLTYVFFQFPIYYILLMCVSSYLTFGVIQGIIIFIPDNLGLIKYENITNSSLTAYCLQTITVAFIFFFSWIANKKRWGFSFVPFREEANFKLKGVNLTIFIIMILGIGVVAIWYRIQNVTLFLSTMALLLCLFLYYSFKKESESLEL
jgi:hypothetical protein